MDSRFFVTMPPDPSRRSNYRLVTWDTLISLPTYHFKHQPYKSSVVLCGSRGALEAGGRVNQVLEIWSLLEIIRSEIRETLDFLARPSNRHLKDVSLEEAPCDATAAGSNAEENEDAT